MILAKPNTFRAMGKHQQAMRTATLRAPRLESDGSATNLHWLINNAGKAPAAAPSSSSEKTNAPTTILADDLSSIKLNLDMV